MSSWLVHPEPDVDVADDFVGRRPTPNPSPATALAALDDAPDRDAAAIRGQEYADHLVVSASRPDDAIPAVDLDSIYDIAATHQHIPRNQHGVINGHFVHSDRRLR
jgi:hypothetical protein